MSTRRPRDYTDEDEEDDIPLHRKRPFGSGVKRTKVEFVKAQYADDTAATAASARRDKAAAIGDLYASVVLAGSSSSSPASKSPTATPTEEKEPAACPVCSLPITGTVEQHNTSLVHQVSLEHSHPPSALDRSRMGLRALEAHGWNPDARLGLGLGGDGMRYPIKIAAKDDTLGIGAVAPETGKGERLEEPKKLSAKEVKLQIQREREKAERMQREIYGRVDVERYLRGDGGDRG